MSEHVINEVRRGFYLDSVALMRLSARLRERPGVVEAVLMIGTESNRGIMDAAGLLTEAGRAAGPEDLVIALRADDEPAARAALAAAEAALAQSVSAAAGELHRPRTLDGALEALPDANLVLISTPGEFAAREARAALARGLNVMIFSDNVSLSEERALKQDAVRRGLLLMGPDCGTAYIAGVPIAFANEVPRGRIGVVAASGTGLQELAVLLARLGAGISHGIGVGGRDLSDAVGGIATHAAIDLLAGNAHTEHVVLISKPPGDATAREVFAHLAACGKPASACVFGIAPEHLPAGVAFAPTLDVLAQQLTGNAIASGDVTARAKLLAVSLPAARRSIRGLFAGGTLCTEAQVVLHAAGLRVHSNAPLHAAARADAPNTLLDLGADEYTLGRPHPMIEPAVRTPLLAAALADAQCAVVLLDVVLGHGAHADPARAVADAVRAAGADRPCVIASVCGTAADPQRRDDQVRALEHAGVVVAESNAAAAALAAAVGAMRQHVAR
jgi:succinyl-CoA synthetase alpha subunit